MVQHQQRVTMNLNRKEKEYDEARRLEVSDAPFGGNAYPDKEVQSSARKVK